MPGDSEQPVTVGDLRVASPRDYRGNEDRNQYRPATVADLVSALRAEGVLVVEKVDGRWPIEVIAGMAGSFYGCRDRGILLTAEAQP